MIPEIRQIKVALTNLEYQLDELIAETYKIKDENARLNLSLNVATEENKKLKEQLAEKEKGEPK